MSRTAVVLFNLGGPDSLDAVRPFLFNLFNDPAILPPPQPIRWLLARYISGRRAPVAREIYAQMGGRSPLMEQTSMQARALETALADLGDVRVFVAMRYWHPRAAETANAVAAWKPDRVVLLPLYPQYSVTTTASSVREWERAARRSGLSVPSRTICCYPSLDGFVAPMAAEAASAVREVAAVAPVRVLLSAHGLPERVIRAGDPYQWQIERTAAALVERAQAALGDLSDIQWRVTYQSRATPEPWLKPDTEEEVITAGAEGRALVMVPIAFVSEHSETLVELDVEYAAVAEKAGVPAYRRVSTVRADPGFVAGLADLVRRALGGQRDLLSDEGGRICPVECRGCPHRAAA